MKPSNKIIKKTFSAVKPERGRDRREDLGDQPGQSLISIWKIENISFYIICKADVYTCSVFRLVDTGRYQLSSVKRKKINLSLFLAGRISAVCTFSVFRLVDTGQVGINCHQLKDRKYIFLYFRQGGSAPVQVSVRWPTDCQVLASDVVDCLFF